MQDLEDKQIDRQFRGNIKPFRPAYLALRDYLTNLDPQVGYYIKTIYVGFEYKNKVFVVVYFTDNGLEVCMRLETPIIDASFHDASIRSWPGIKTAFYLREPEELTEQICKILKQAFESVRNEVDKKQR